MQFLALAEKQGATVPRMIGHRLLVAFNGDAQIGLSTKDTAVQFLALAEKQGATVPLMVGHRLTGESLLFTGDIAGGRAHYDQAIALYNPAKHRPLATRFGQDVGVAILGRRSWALWLLGYPQAALADAEQALRVAREIGHAATLMYGLRGTSLTQALRGNYTTSNALVDELVALADEKAAALWKAFGMMNQGWVLARTGNASDAIKMLTSGITAYRSTGSTLFLPFYLSYLAHARAERGQFDDARRCIGEAMTRTETTKERLWRS